MRLPSARALLLILVAAGLVAAAYAFYATLRSDGPGRGAQGPGYAGSPACVECHAAQHRAWSASHHALAMQDANSETVLGDFENSVFVQGRDTTRFFRAEGRFWVRTAGEDGRMGDYLVPHTFGVQPLQQYLLRLPRGRLQALGVAWDTRPKEAGGQRWYSLYPDEPLAPGDPLHWTGRDQNWNYMCAECHVTDLVRGYDAATASYETRYAEQGVGCEACHGPGAEHVRWARAGGAKRDSSLGLLLRFQARRRGSWVRTPEAPIARREPPLESHEELTACAACHSRRRVLREGRLPNEPLLDTHVPVVLEDPLYFADGGIHGEVFEFGSFVQSKMFQAGVSCGDCHEPHGLGLRAQGNELCTQCHAPARYDAESHHFHPPGTEASLCVSCHMPDRTYMGIDDRRDHSFGVPRPELTRSTGSPNACNGCHGDRSASWAARAIATHRPPAPIAAHRFAEALQAGREEQAEWVPALARSARDEKLPAIVRATALRLLSSVSLPVVRDLALRGLSDADPLVRLEAVGGAAGLETESRLAALEPLLRDELLAIRTAAARALAGVPAERFSAEARAGWQAALAEFVAAERVNAERPEAHLNLGNLYLDLGRLAEAEAEYRTALHLDSAFAPATVNWADLLRLQGRDATADSLLTALLARAPDTPDALFARGLARVRLGRTAEARRDLRRAAESRPDDVRMQIVHALAEHAAGASSEALGTLRAAHQRRPGNPDLLYTLATLERDLGRRGEALSRARALLRQDATNPVAVALVAELERPPAP
jgi:predicted CXXCH cytochrome family protein